MSKAKERKSKGGRKVKEREVAPGVVEFITTFGGLTHVTTEISPGADRDAAFRAYLESQPFGAMYLARQSVFWAKRVLRDHDLPTRSTPKKPLLDHLDDLGYEPLDEQRIAAEFLVHCEEILKLPVEFEPVIEHAMSFGQALYKQHLIAEIARVSSERGKGSRTPTFKAAAAEWLRKIEANYPGRPVTFALNRIRNIDPFKSEAEPEERAKLFEAGVYLIWCQGDRICIFDKVAKSKDDFAAKTFYNWMLDARKKNSR